MEMPKPTEQHRKYQSMVGTFKGDETLHPMPWEPKMVKVASKSVNRLDLDGFFLIIDHEQTRDGRIAYRGHGVYGFDAGKSKWTMYWFDVMGCGFNAPALGTWEGNTLRYEHAHERGHSRYTYKFEKEGQYTLAIEMSQDGKSWTPFLTGTYTRVSK